MASSAENKRLFSVKPQAKSFYFGLIFLFNTKSKDLATLQINACLLIKAKSPMFSYILL